MTTATDRRVLVTGATGFIGRHALRPLLDRGFAVHAVSRAGTAPSSSPVAVTWHVADLRNPADAAAVIARVRPTHLLHFAWYAEHGKFWTAPENLDWLAATMHLLRRFAEAGGRRFVGAGTCAEYDWGDVDELLDEGLTPLRPGTLYGAAKASVFLSGSAYAKSAGMSFAWGRVFHLFGPGEAPARLVPSLIRAHLAGAPLECGRSDVRRDLLPAAAVAEAFAHLCAVEPEGAFNIGSGHGTTFGELSETIAGLAGSRGDVRFGSVRDTGPDSLVPSVARLVATGWNPPESLQSPLAEAVDWWKTRT